MLAGVCSVGTVGDGLNFHARDLTLAPDGCGEVRGSDGSVGDADGITGSIAGDEPEAIAGIAVTMVGPIRHEEPA